VGQELQDLASEAVGMRDDFPLVELGYDPGVVDVRIAELEQELLVLRSELGAGASADEISARAREIVLRAMNRALLATYESVAEATREVETYRAEVLAELELERMATDAELTRARDEVLRLRAQLVAPDAEALARERAEQILARAEAEARILRASAGHMATEQLARVRAEWHNRIEAHREALELARADAERERAQYLELRRRVSERLGAVGSAELLEGLGEPARSASVASPEDEAAFRRFFDNDVDEEPSRSWILGPD
jgi:hypothetical protein